MYCNAEKMMAVLQDWQAQFTSSLTYSVLPMQDFPRFSCESRRTHWTVAKCCSLSATTAIVRTEEMNRNFQWIVTLLFRF